MANERLASAIPAKSGALTDLDRVVIFDSATGKFAHQPYSTLKANVADDVTDALTDTVVEPAQAAQQAAETAQAGAEAAEAGASAAAAYAAEALALAAQERLAAAQHEQNARAAAEGAGIERWKDTYAGLEAERVAGTLAAGLAYGVLTDESRGGEENTVYSFDGAALTYAFTQLTGAQKGRRGGVAAYDDAPVVVDDLQAMKDLTDLQDGQVIEVRDGVSGRFQYKAASAEATDEVTEVAPATLPGTFGIVSLPEVAQVIDGRTAINARHWLRRFGYGDIGEAITAAAAWIYSKEGMGGIIYVPRARADDGSLQVAGTRRWVMKTPVELPYLSNLYDRWALVFTPGAALDLHAAFPAGEYVISNASPAASVSGSQAAANWLYENVAIVNNEGVATAGMIRINDVNSPKILHPTINGVRGVGIELRSPVKNGGAHWARIEHPVISLHGAATTADVCIKTGDTADPSRCNGTVITGGRLTAAGGIAFLLKYGYATAIFGGDVDYCEVGIDAYSHFRSFATRWEGGYGPGGKCIVPIRIADTVTECEITNPIAGADFWAACQLSGRRHRIAGVDWHEVYRDAMRGGAGWRPMWSVPAGAARGAAESTITLPNVDGTERVMDFGGGKAVLASEYPAMRFRFRMDHNNYYCLRMGLYADESNLLELVFDPQNHLSTGLTSYWFAQAKVGGAHLADAEGGTPSPDARQDMMLGTNDWHDVSFFVEKGAAGAYRYRVVLDGYTLGLFEGGDVGALEPRLYMRLVGVTGTQKVLRLKDFHLDRRGVDEIG